MLVSVVFPKGSARGEPSGRVTSNSVSALPVVFTISSAFPVNVNALLRPTT